MRMIVPVLATLAFVSMAPLAAYAGQSGLYTMTPVGESTIRLNTQTGDVSRCYSGDESWVCEAVADNHIDAQREAARLERENEALRAEVAQLKRTVRRAEQKLSDAKQQPVGPAPSDEAVDEMMTVLEKMIRRFQDMVESLENKPPQKQL